MFREYRLASPEEGQLKRSSAVSRIRREPAFCTIVARNYLAQARVLARSLSNFHPERRLHVLVIDAEPGMDASAEPFQLVSPNDLSLTPDEYRNMATIYEVTELATAVKPWVLALLLDRGASAAIYLDPDIEIFAPLDDLVTQAVENEILLIPHTLKPIPEDGLRPTPDDVRLSGVFNLGFLGVSPEAAPLIEWWQNRLRRDCIVSVDEGLFVDQRLMDFVPGFFRHFVHRDPTSNVAYWNLHDRTLSWTGEAFEVGGRPLRFFHFSGYDPLVPSHLSKHSEPNPRIRLIDQPALARLCEQYGSKLLAAGYRECIELKYGFGTSASGLPIDRRSRRLYRASLIAFERGEVQTPPPDPFTMGGSDAFTAWLAEPHVPESTVSRYLYGLYLERGDVRAAFPDLRGPDANRYLEWVTIDGRADPPIPDVFIRSLPRSRGGTISAVPVTAEGLNVIGYVKAELGVGEAARLLIAAAAEAGIPYSVVVVDTPWSRQQARFTGRDIDPIYDVNLVCINADQLPAFVSERAQSLWPGRYCIAYWWWEVDEFPAHFASVAEHVDEIWVGSGHAARAISRAVVKPVLTMPLSITAGNSPTVDRSSLGLPDCFVFFFSFDFHSVFERKNPLGLINAYRQAFETTSDAYLLIKTINGDDHPSQLKELRSAAAGRSDIEIQDGYVGGDQLHAITQSIDAYVSLHRAEGHGLTLAEAMAAGKPVIATAYSGNLEYMTNENSFLVPYKLVRIGDGHEPYPASAHWAEPDLEAAAGLMRLVFEDREEVKRRVACALRNIAEIHSPAVRGQAIAERLRIVRQIQQTRTLEVTAATKPAPAFDAGQASDALSARVRAATMALHGPSIRSPRIAVRAVQAALLRVLSPLVNHERDVFTAVLEALAEAESRWWHDLRNVQHRIDETRAGQQQVTENVQTQLDALDYRLSEHPAVERDLARIEQRVGELEHATNMTSATTGWASAQLGQLVTDVVAIRADLDALRVRMFDAGRPHIVSQASPAHVVTVPPVSRHVAATRTSKAGKLRKGDS